MPLTKLLAVGALSVPAEPEPAAPAPAPAPASHAVSLPVARWGVFKARKGVLGVEVPILPAAWGEASVPPERVELRVFDVPVPEDFPADQFDALLPVARLELPGPAGPDLVLFEVEGLAGGAPYSAAAFGHWAD